MDSSNPCSRRGDSQLWCIALILSLLVNVAAVALIGIGHAKLSLWQKPASSPPSPPADTVAIIYPQQFQPPPRVPDATPRPKRFARTTADQSSPKPERSAFIGERNTQTRSDRTPAPDAPALPSQAGAEPRFEGDYETTESDYRDGSLNHTNPAETATLNQQSTPPAQPGSTEGPNDAATAEPPSKMAQTESSPSQPPARDQLLEGPNPVDVSVPKEHGTEDSIKPPSEKPNDAEALKTPAKQPPAPPTKANDPAFSGFQRKTAITGSISRTGRSALDVEDSPLGRYHAAISRAVELEWQRNCVRHRDFITPGFLTVRFFVEPSGRVRSVQFVGDMESGEVQKGFTLNSIRNARIPAMPPALRKQYDQEPLELIFRFFF